MLGDPAFGRSWMALRAALVEECVRHLRPGLIVCERCHRRHHPREPYDAMAEVAARHWHSDKCELSLGR